MPRVQSLAEFLEPAAAGPSEPNATPQDEISLATDSKTFAEAVLNSPEFKTYIRHALTLGTIPAAVICRLMDYCWGKPPDRVELTGRDGRPVETVRIVRIVVDAKTAQDAEREEAAAAIQSSIH